MSQKWATIACIYPLVLQMSENTLPFFQLIITMNFCMMLKQFLDWHAWCECLRLSLKNIKVCSSEGNLYTWFGDSNEVMSNWFAHNACWSPQDIFWWSILNLQICCKMLMWCFVICLVDWTKPKYWICYLLVQWHIMYVS
jgi:hypothetical protein